MILCTLSPQVKQWVVAPYKKPWRDRPDNAEFNNHVSMLRIRSEHAIGFLKGRFQSLRGLRVSVRNEASHKLATYWIVACIAVHGFAMKQEALEREDESSDDGDDWDFIANGLSPSVSDNEREEPTVPLRRSGGG